MLDFIFEELTPTLDKSKQVIKMLLKEMQALQSSIEKMKAECGSHKTMKSTDENLPESGIFEEETINESNELETEWTDKKKTSFVLNEGQISFEEATETNSEWESSKGVDCWKIKILLRLNSKT